MPLRHFGPGAAAVRCCEGRVSRGEGAVGGVREVDGEDGVSRIEAGDGDLGPVVSAVGRAVEVVAGAAEAEPALASVLEEQRAGTGAVREIADAGLGRRTA